MEQNVKAQLPDFTRELSKNRTLKTFQFFPGDHSFNNKYLIDPALEAITERNRAFQQYACSQGFIAGAACGYFESMTFPAELGDAVAPYLAQETPLNQAALLAFVNKTTYLWALEMRQRTNAAAVKEMLAAGSETARPTFWDMALMLPTIAAMKQDLSDDDIRKLAAVPVLPSALQRFKTGKLDAYDDLVARFHNARCSQLLRKLDGLTSGKQAQSAKKAPSS